MLRVVLKSKVHRATVIKIDLEYEGSLTMDRDLMEVADLIPFEQVQVYNVTNGERFITYVIEGGTGTGTICINGAAARKASVGDTIIVASYAVMDVKEAKKYHPRVIVVDERNRPAYVSIKGKLVPLKKKKGKNIDNWLLEP